MELRVLQNRKPEGDQGFPRTCSFLDTTHFVEDSNGTEAPTVNAEHEGQS